MLRPLALVLVLAAFAVPADAVEQCKTVVAAGRIHMLTVCAGADPGIGQGSISPRVWLECSYDMDRKPLCTTTG